MADEEQTTPPIPDGIYDRTTDRVAGMSDEARAALHRKIHGQKKTVADEGFKRPAKPPFAPSRAVKEHADPSAEIIRIEAELHRTERRIVRMERSFSRGRFQTGSDAPAHGRYARLLTRADRLERQLRELQ